MQNRTSTGDEAPRRKFRRPVISLFTLGLTVAILAIGISYYASNRKHWESIATLRQGGFTITYRRETPTRLDRVLGDYRFDEIKLVRAGDVGPDYNNEAVHAIGGLRSLDCFYQESADWPTGTQFLTPIAGKIKELNILTLPPDPKVFLPNLRIWRVFRF